MKYSIAILAAVSAVVAQDVGSLPACGQTCIGNMIGIATSTFGCATGDVNCYCSKMDFGYGVRDCSNEACGSSQEANQVIQFGTNYCAQALQSAGEGASTIVASGLSILSSAAQQTGAMTTGSGEGSNPTPASTPVTTSPLETTVTSDGQTIVQTTGLVTLYGPAGGAMTTPTDAAGSAATSASDAAGSAASSVASDASGALSSATEAISSAASSAASAASSNAGGAPSNSPGAAPRMTAAPMLAGAGIAALLFI